MHHVGPQVRDSVMWLPCRSEPLRRVLSWGWRDDHVADTTPTFISVKDVDRRRQKIATVVMDRIWVAYLEVFDVSPVKGGD